MQFPSDYLERVYAGVLGKIIGVYLGRPIEGWSYEKITEQFGEIDYYVNEKLNVPLVVTDDDISGTFTFLRALADYGNDPDITPAQIGQTWLNYIVEEKSVLWWGGNGISTEHTAFLRLKHGIAAPESGSIALNGRVVAEQIGAQIFIDGWGLICPGDPERAVDFARRAASVSHDGEAIYGAQVVAALVAMVFVEQDIVRMIDVAASLIPADSTIRRMIDEIREWHAAEPHDWRATRKKIAEKYGYDKYGGGCHMVPNHSLIIHALLHGGGDFSRSQMIVNTCGWDTDCNAANVGCILGVRGGLAGLDKDRAAGKDWRGPVADRLFLPSADGGRCVTDAVQEALRIVDIAHGLAGLKLIAPKEGARFSFALPGSVQGFTANSPEITLSNINGNGLTLRFDSTRDDSPARVKTATFPTLEEFKRDGYGLPASPTLYPGQLIEARVSASAENRSPVSVRLVVEHIAGQDTISDLYGESYELQPGAQELVRWYVPETGRQPITTIGFEVEYEQVRKLQPGEQQQERLAASQGMILPFKPTGAGVVQALHRGAITIDYLTWSGAPDCGLHRPETGGDSWMKAWVSAADPGVAWEETTGFRLCSNEGLGMAIQGAHEWQDYTFTATIQPQLANRVGIAGRVQGLKRYYAMLLTHPDRAQLVRCMDGETILAETPFEWSFQSAYELSMTFRGSRVVASANGKLLFDHEDTITMLDGGAVGLIVESGNLIFEAGRIGP